jgi:hypothetical protein
MWCERGKLSKNENDRTTSSTINREIRPPQRCVRGHRTLDRRRSNEARLPALGDRRAVPTRSTLHGIPCRPAARCDQSRWCRSVLLVAFLMTSTCPKRNGGGDWTLYGGKGARRRRRRWMRCEYESEVMPWVCESRNRSTRSHRFAVGICWGCLHSPNFGIVVPGEYCRLLGKLTVCRLSVILVPGEQCSKRLRVFDVCKSASPSLAIHPRRI